MYFIESEDDEAIGLEENYQRASDMFDIARSLKIDGKTTYENFETMLENEGFESLVIYKLCVVKLLNRYLK